MAFFIKISSRLEFEYRGKYSFFLSVDRLTERKIEILSPAEDPDPLPFSLAFSSVFCYNEQYRKRKKEDL